MDRAPARRRLPRGVTLIELSVTVAVVGILASLAWPSHLAQAQRARRLDATHALTTLQQAQEQFRLRHGAYATDLAQLGRTGRLSPQGQYELAVVAAAPGRVTLAARARPGGDQRNDRDCAEITLALNEGVADPGPSGRCWSL